MTLVRLETVRTDSFRGWMIFDRCFSSLKNGTMSKLNASIIIPVPAPLPACLSNYELEYSSNQHNSWAADSSMRLTKAALT